MKKLRIGNRTVNLSDTIKEKKRKNQIWHFLHGNLFLLLLELKWEKIPFWSKTFDKSVSVQNCRRHFFSNLQSIKNGNFGFTSPYRFWFCTFVNFCLILNVMKVIVDFKLFSLKAIFYTFNAIFWYKRLSCLQVLLILVLLFSLTWNGQK